MTFLLFSVLKNLHHLTTKKLYKGLLNSRDKSNEVVNPQSTPQLLAKDRRKSMVCLGGGSVFPGEWSSSDLQPKIRSDRQHSSLLSPTCACSDSCRRNGSSAIRIPQNKHPRPPVIWKTSATTSAWERIDNPASSLKKSIFPFKKVHRNGLWHCNHFFI